MYLIDSDGATETGDFKVSPPPATILDPFWLNTVQRELATIITHPTGGDADLEKGNTGQLLAAVLTMIARAMATAFDFSATLPGHYALPGGALIQFGRATAAANSSTVVTLPIEYDVLFAGAWVNGTDDGSVDAQDNWPTAKVPTSGAAFTIRNANDSADQVAWFTFGFRTA